MHGQAVRVKREDLHWPPVRTSFHLFKGDFRFLHSRKSDGSKMSKVLVLVFFFFTFEFAGIARFVVSNVPNLRLEYESKPTWMEHVAIKGYWSFLAVWKRGKGGHSNR